MMPHPEHREGWEAIPSTSPTPPASHREAWVGPPKSKQSPTAEAIPALPMYTHPRGG